METKQTELQTELQTHLKSIGACAESSEWAGERTPQQAWDECQNPSWLLWWAGHTDVNPVGQIVLAACDCARTALCYVPSGETRPLVAIDAAERWVNNQTLANRETVAKAAGAAAKAAAWAAEAATEAATEAAEAATEAAADAAAEAAWAAAQAARAAAQAARAARAAEIKLCNLIRSRLVLPYVSK